MFQRLIHPAGRRSRSPPEFHRRFPQVTASSGEHMHVLFFSDGLCINHSSVTIEPPIDVLQFIRVIILHMVENSWRHSLSGTHQDDSTHHQRFPREILVSTLYGVLSMSRTANTSPWGLSPTQHPPVRSLITNRSGLWMLTRLLLLRLLFPRIARMSDHHLVRMILGI